MQPDRLLPQHWLVDTPLRPDERLYAVFSTVSNADPLLAYRRHDGTRPPQPLWADTAYAGWKAVMPYLVELTPDSGFLDWCDHTPEQDWGWLAVSSHPPQALFKHLRSLTQVRVPGGTTVFYRYWDGRHLLPALNHNAPRPDLPLCVFSRFWINGQGCTTTQIPLPAEQDFPWWQVPQTLMSCLHEQAPAAHIRNLMQWLRDEHPTLYFARPAASLQRHVEDFVRGDVMDEHSATRLLTRLHKDLA